MQQAEYHKYFPGNFGQMCSLILIKIFKFKKVLINYRFSILFTLQYLYIFRKKEFLEFSDNNVFVKKKCYFKTFMEKRHVQVHINSRS